MNTLRRSLACLISLLALTVTARAEDYSVFAIRASNGVETIQGALVLNREAVRTATLNGFSFASPVDFLYYTISDASGVLGDFTLKPENPNTLTITKEAGGATHFFLLVEPVPTDPPFPTPPAFVMEFTYPNEAPWGDTVPDRTIEGAVNVSLAASDLYDQSVMIEEVTLSELSKQLRDLNPEFKNIRKYLPKKNGS